MASCRCNKCVSLCHKMPGWPTPTEARAMIHAGLAGKLMRDWFEPDDELGNEERIYVLCPAIEDCGGQDAPEMDFSHWLMSFTNTISMGCCVFLGDDNLCQIHKTKYKPVQCRSAFGCEKDDSAMLRKPALAKMWRSKVGQTVLREWQESLS